MTATLEMCKHCDDHTYEQLRVIVCGGRDYDNAERVFNVLDKVHVERVITELAHGGATGADRLAGEWARRNGVPVRVFRADWSRYLNRAGPIRNERMLYEFMPDLVIAFPGGRGTAHMISIAERAGVEVMRA